MRLSYLLFLVPCHFSFSAALSPTRFCGSSGFLWVPLGSSGFLWVLLGSSGLTHLLPSPNAPPPAHGNACYNTEGQRAGLSYPRTLPPPLRAFL